MDLIYMNTAFEDVGVITDASMDVAIGKDENDFKCEMALEKHCCEAGYYLYYEGTEYGGVIDAITIDTGRKEVAYSGRTWHGILASKNIDPLLESDESGNGCVVGKGGKNLIPYPYYVMSGNTAGIQFSTDEYGIITANGTSTAQISSLWTILNKCTLKSGIYTLSGCPSGGSTSSYRLRIGTGTENKFLGEDLGKGFAFTLEEDTEITIAAQVFAGATVKNLTFKPQLEVGNKATSYKPYSSLLGKYLMLSGEANKVIGWMIERLGLSSLFSASEEDSGITISNYKMNRYIDGYSGIKKMLKSEGAKLKFNFVKGKVILHAERRVDYSQDEQFNSDQIEFKITKTYAPINHCICLGKGELTEREVIHLYADSQGRISHTQSVQGIAERVAVYENTNAESTEELEEGGIELIKESWNADDVDFNFDSDAESYDIGDLIGAKEQTTGIAVSAEITKKIVKIDKGKTTINYKVGD